MASPKKLLIVYYSQSGSTNRMADAVVEGARDPDAGTVDVRLLSALEAAAEDVLAADGLILGTPENFGYMSGALKYFFDQNYYACLDKVAGKPYALFVRAGNDGQGAIESVTRIVTGLKLKAICDPVLASGDFTDECLEECRELGRLFTAGLEGGIF
ncbi:MAG: flavodoxin family protein [Woeseia sp.]|nr:NAD(P)H-dependent oxidoreductase [Woeseia sp.]MBT8095984.1 NAD(P)H-dependent oxidoreductase [Woeseia sp.]NNE61580.1 flavodoxin family protein [Woeseia sp.]NNL54012.1 flavodoxin family protein [Woeseia sp.]